jgi:uncharacterized protein (TIGR03435 family)
MEDQTEIEGSFGLELTFIRDAPLSAVPGTLKNDPAGPALADALADDLNNTLRSETGPVPALTVQRVERPTPN